MQDIAVEPDRVPDFDKYLERASALELARRSLIGAPVYTVISLIMLTGTPILMDYGWWAMAEAALLFGLGGIRVWFALGFRQRYEHIGEQAVVQFSILTALQSLCLGVLAGMVIWEYWAAQEAVLTIVLSAGCIAAGTSALSVRRSAHFIFLVCVLAPFGLSVLLVGGFAKALLILGFLFLMGFLVQDGGQAKRTYIERMKEHYEDQMNLRRTAVETQAKKQFLADIGHEIRTPVTSILGMTALLLEQDLEKKPRESVEIIRKSGNTLLNLVNNIPGSVLTQSKPQEALIGSMNPRKSVRKVMELYRFMASGKGIELKSHLQDLPDTIIFSEEDHLKEVLANLLSNAMEFTERGSVTVSASCQALEDGDLKIEFCVSDTGVGIPPGQLVSIFDPFGPDSAKTSDRRGGLGLPLSKGLVELMGGEISIESREGRGTNVRFTITAQRDPADTTWNPVVESGAVAETGFTADLSQDHPHRILVVDDDAVHRQFLCALLGKMGYQADEAADGQEAVVGAINGNYDLIFMDLRMPVMNGLEANRWIRNHLEKDGKLRVIALTGDASRKAREQCLMAGMDEFIPKPIQVDNLKNILRAPATRA